MAKKIGKCVYCDDPIFDFQRVTVDGKFIPLHEGCIHLLATTISAPITKVGQK